MTKTLELMERGRFGGRGEERGGMDVRTGAQGLLFWANGLTLACPFGGAAAKLEREQAGSRAVAPSGAARGSPPTLHSPQIGRAEVTVSLH